MEAQRHDVVRLQRQVLVGARQADRSTEQPEVGMARCNRSRLMGRPCASPACMPICRPTRSATATRILLRLATLATGAALMACSTPTDSSDAVAALSITGADTLIV